MPFCKVSLFELLHNGYMNGLDLMKRDLLSETQSCIELFDSQVFVNRQIFTQSAFIEILIRLNYLLQKIK